MKDNDPDRRVEWTKAARADMKFLVEKRGFTRSDFQRLAATLNLVACQQCPEDHPWVTGVRFAEKYGETVFRVKHTGLTVSVRVIFEWTVDAVVVWACLERTANTYRIAEDRLLDFVRGILA